MTADELIAELRRASALPHPLLGAPMMIDAADALEAAAAEIERLRQWKAEGMEVLDAWERVYDALGQPGHLGQSKAAASENEVVRLVAALEPFVRGLAFDDDEPDRCGWCAFILTGEHHSRCPMPAALDVFQSVRPGDLVCSTCGGQGWYVVGQTEAWPYGEQNQCPDCADAAPELSDEFDADELLENGFDAVLLITGEPDADVCETCGGGGEVPGLSTDGEMYVRPCPACSDSAAAGGTP